MAQIPVILLPLPSVPEQCGDCGTRSNQWPLGVYGGRLVCICPTCNVAVATVAAVHDGQVRYPEDESLRAGQ